MGWSVGISSANQGITELSVTVSGRTRTQHECGVV